MKGAAAGAAAALFPSARVRAAGPELWLRCAGVEAKWTVDAGRFRYVSLYDRIAGRSIPLPREVFSLRIGEDTIPGSAFEVAQTSAESVTLVHRGAGIRVDWRGLAHGAALYVRQELEIHALDRDVDLREVRMFDFPFLPDAYVAGRVDGSPIVSRTIFGAVEHPLSQSEAIYDRASAWLPRRVPLRAQAPLAVSGVIGVTRPGQLRRDFLTYVESERARPYSPFLHYNSWYDIGYFTRYDQAECLDRIHAFGQALHMQRGVTLKSFLFDDGWDDPNHLWQFNSGFPGGFAPLGAAARSYGAAPGAWLSPWGGYGKPREQRLAAARAAGYEIDEDGLALSGPKYDKLFVDVVERFIRSGGVNQFKIDGTGSAAQVFPGSQFGSDFEAAIALISDMRRLEPEIYVNLTTGTYPSPFWLRYCDSIWRGGEDHDFAGVGTHRQRWITYRDADTYAGIVVQGPLYPLNSLMLHGLIYAQHAKHLNDDPHGDFANEVHSYFATGTQLQEMYCTPQLLSRGDWDDIARWARWSAANADVLRDTHWIGGNPGRLDVYGWAAWSRRKGIITLRNPSSRRQEYPLDIGTALELPDGAPRRYRAGTQTLAAGKPQLCTLEPFEVRTIEALPLRA
ncbi:MAG TPA: enterotoxin [Candidatus Baltobacteraceae bacterium]|nr:enterotoxin [Candidatus Baltobacteraceae bacterium]